jgi:hypothetical protein
MSPSVTRVLQLLSLVVVFLFAGTAHADKIDTLIGQLERSSDYKVRLSAALNLAKIGDKRAVSPLIRALKDGNRTVRGVAAAGLGKLVDSDVSKKTRKRALSALKTASKKDSNSFVRKQALKAYNAIKGMDGGGAAAVSGSIYVNIGPMAAKRRDDDEMKPLMRKTIVKTFSKKASSMMTKWPGAANPSKKQIKKKGVMAFHVDGTLTELQASPGGSSTKVSCKVSMLLATYPEKSMFGFLKGGAKVQTGTSAQDIRYAKEDCVAAVIEDLIARKIIPTIKTRAR